MAKGPEITCNNCYFRREELCAIPGDKPCPTFRPVGRTLEPPRQPQLVPQPHVHATAAA